MEANIYFTEFGNRIFLWAKIVELKGFNLSNKEIERVCSKLRDERHLAAIPYDDKQGILVISKTDLNGISLTEGNWKITLEETGKKVNLKFKNTADREKISQLLIRGLYATLSETSFYRRLDSPKIWYETEPFLKEKDVNIFRRFEVSEVIVPEKGVGITVQASTSYLESLLPIISRMTKKLDSIESQIDKVIKKEH